MKLITRPDCELVHPILTLEKEYTIKREIGNGVVITADDGETDLIILKSRFEDEN